MTPQAPAIHMVNHRSRLFSCQKKAAWSFREKSSWKSHTHFPMLAWEMTYVTSTHSPLARLILPFYHHMSRCIFVFTYCAQQLVCALDLRLPLIMEKFSIVIFLNCFPVFPLLSNSGNLIRYTLETPYLFISPFSIFFVTSLCLRATLKMISSVPASTSPIFPLI